VIYGLTVWEWTILSGLLAGLVFLTVGVIGMLWPRRTHTGGVFEFVWGRFKVRSNVMAFGVVIGGIVVFFGSGWFASRTTPRFPLTGRIALDDGRTISGISVGLVPPEHYAVTAANGTFKLEVPRPSSNETGSYQAVLYYRDRDHLRAEIAPVNIDQNWNATVDHKFGRQ